MTWGDILTNEKMVIWEKKTGKKNIRYLNADIGKAIEFYQKQIEIDFGDYTVVDYCFGDYVFPSKSKTGYLTIQGLDKILKEMKEDLDITDNFSTHTMRKTFAYWYLMNNKGNSRALTKLCALLNHSSISMTLRYAGISDDENKEIFEDMSKFYVTVDNGTVRTYDDKITISRGQVEDLLRYAYSLRKEPVMDFNTDVDNLAALNGTLADLEL